MEPHPNRRFHDRYHQSRTGIECCACIDNVKGSMFACLIWAGFSFYFAVLAFMQQSPFYSYLNSTLLIVSGVVNMVYGLVSTIVLLITIFKRRFTQHRMTAYVMGFSTVMVLADALVNFVIFAKQSDEFNTWCTQSAVSAMQEANQSLNTTMDASSDTYNCYRLYNDEVKWGLLGVVVMFVFYIHWTLVVASAIGTNFFQLGIAPPPPVQSLANLASGSKLKLTEHSNIQPRSNEPAHQAVDMHSATSE